MREIGITKAGYISRNAARVAEFEAYGAMWLDLVPRFGGIPTFMRLPHTEDPAGVDIGLIGVPWDGGTTNRPGARHGPQGVASGSMLMVSS